MVTARVAVWDWPCRPIDLIVLRCGLTMLADVLGLTTRNKSRPVENLNPNYVR